MPRVPSFEAFEKQALELCAASPQHVRLVLKQRPCDASCTATISNNTTVRRRSLQAYGFLLTRFHSRRSLTKPRPLTLPHY